MEGSSLQTVPSAPEHVVLPAFGNILQISLTPLLGPRLPWIISSLSTPSIEINPPPPFPRKQEFALLF